MSRAAEFKAYADSIPDSPYKALEIMKWSSDRDPRAVGVLRKGIMEFTFTDGSQARVDRAGEITAYDRRPS